MKRTAIALAFALISFSAFAQDKPRGVMPAPTGTVGGFVTTVSGNLITLLNGSVALDATGAAFQNRRGTATIADVKPGMQIVAGISNVDATPGTLLKAANVLILDAPAGTLNGPVQAVDVAGSTLTIFGARVLVNANTRIYVSKRDTALKLSDIKPGDVATVELSVTGSTLVADTIYVFAKTPVETPKPNPPSESSLQGTVKSISSTAWVITTREGDVSVPVNSATKIDPAIIVGDSVSVMLGKDASGNRVAIAIMKAGAGPGKKR